MATKNKEGGEKNMGDDAVITLGRKNNGTLAQATLGEMKHLLIGGISGAGKTVALKRIVKQLIEQGVEVYMFDGKKVGFFDFKGKKHFHLATATEQISPLLQAITNEMTARYQKMEQENTDVCKAGRIVFIVDEGAELFESCSKNDKEQIRRILSLGRQCGIYLIMATQRPSRRMFSGEIVDLFPSRLALKCATTNSSRVILDKAGAEYLALFSAIWLDPKGNFNTIQLLPPEAEEDEIVKISDTLSGLDF